MCLVTGILTKRSRQTGRLRLVRAAPSDHQQAPDDVIGGAELGVGFGSMHGTVKHGAKAVKQGKHARGYNQEVLNTARSVPEVCFCFRPS